MLNSLLFLWLFTLLRKRSTTCFCILKCVTVLWIRTSTELANQETLSWVYIFFFSIPYLYDAKNMLPGLSFFCGCLQKRGAKKIYLFDPSHKDNELRNSGVQQREDWERAHPAILGPASEERIRLQVWHPLLLSGSTLTALLKSQCVCVCWLQGLLYVTVISLACFDQRGLQVSDSAQH